ncbi:YoaK family protein [Gallaecimonas mangrovi]|uniref:YoaK family protein n=1 Tax=Gallaecimonas mangrovi TaxID=2291597 RepID=UPI000E207125|nr:YoaK family protein [Gallaecimonas mangrovi]
MISRLPKWIEYGALLLALVAGLINAIALVGFAHQSVSHLSGTATLLGSAIGELEAATILHLTGIVAAFVLGAALSGVMLHDTTLQLGRHYDTALVLEAAFIFLALYLFNLHSPWAYLAAAAACGLQNALATTYSGAVVRTTHLTGIFTDLGLMLGALLRGEAFDRRKLKLFLMIIFGFMLGGGVGALLFDHFRYGALVLPGVMCLLLALVYRLYSKKQGQ